MDEFLDGTYNLRRTSSLGTVTQNSAGSSHFHEQHITTKVMESYSDLWNAWVEIYTKSWHPQAKQLRIEVPQASPTRKQANSYLQVASVPRPHPHKDKARYSSSVAPPFYPLQYPYLVGSHPPAHPVYRTQGCEVS